MVLDRCSIICQDTPSTCSWEAEPQRAMGNPTLQINSLTGCLLTKELPLAREGHMQPPPTVSLAMAALRVSRTAWEEDLETSA